MVLWNQGTHLQSSVILELQGITSHDSSRLFFVQSILEDGHDNIYIYIYTRCIYTYIYIHWVSQKLYQWIMKANKGPLLKGTTPLDDFRKKYICAFLPMELRTYARAKTPKPLELRWIFSFFFQVWKHGMLFFCARGIILCSGDGHLVDKAAFRTFWATD